MSSSSSWDSVVDASAPLQNLNRTVIGSHILFSFSIGPALARDIISSLPSPLYAIITDDIVHELYGRELARAFDAHGARAENYVLHNGEPHKSRHSKELIEDWMVSTWLKRTVNNLLCGQVGCGCTRRTVVVSLGGGVVGDLAGFVASTCSPCCCLHAAQLLVHSPFRSLYARAGT